MSIDSLESQIKRETESGMTAVNIASMPFRAMNVVVGGVIHLAASTNPVAQIVISQLSHTIHEGWHNSTIGKEWDNTRISIINDFKKLDIPESESSYFLDSVEELVIAAGTAGVGSIAKAALKSAKRFTAQIKGKDSGFPVIDDIYFKPKTCSKNISEHPFAIGNPGEGMIDYHYVRGSQNSVLIYLDYIQKGKVYNWNVESSLSKGLAPYSTSQAALGEIKEIAKQIGSERVFLQFEPKNPKFRAFVEKNYPLKGNHKVRDHFWSEEMNGPYPVFELTSAAARGTTTKIIKLISPFAASETMHALASGSYIEQDLLSFSLVSPAKAKDFSLDHSHIQDRSFKELHPTPEVSDEFLEHMGQELLSFSGKISGVTPALEELIQVKDLVQTLLRNPTDAPIKIVAHLFKTPQAMVRNVLQQPEAILKNCQNFVNNPGANYMGALSAVSGILTFMDSVSWIVDFAKSPKKTALSIVKMPYTTVEGVIKLGAALIKHPEKAAGELFKSLVKAPAVTVKRFLTSVGLKKKRKRRQQAPTQILIDPAEQMRIAQQYAKDLMALYSLARSKWMLDPYKTAEDYHYDLLADWNGSAASLGGNYYAFPRFLTAKLEQNDLQAIRQYSPFAHYFEPLPPPEVIMHTLLETTLVMAKVEIASTALAVSHEVDVQATQQLNIERERLKANTSNLSALLANPDELKQKLLARLNK
jgi:hypothetical protein